MDEYGFETRLRHLEHIIAGDQIEHLSRSVQGSLTLRCSQLAKELNILYKNNKSLQDFATKYDPYAKVLNPTNSTYDMERELLQPETKLELVLAAYDDLERLANEVKQVKSLEHVVDGSDLKVDKLGNQLSPLELDHEQQAKQLADLTSRISQAMDNYNGTINTLSEIFIAWDDVLSTMEHRISQLEGPPKKKEEFIE
ncbi:uncharacterized protein BX664DRAFT_340440 [Halteromyces radiatus]|uniref:uncharacterized protein n=1 Tax=Halteromyces radiatus TaxID=101107 RepID=UPI00221F870F|nr:uncharacterized protein BX664DRAFT_340440 [Halteromyces radiatus]KAI8081459.1 hypothetical protein BX664DRAFT_340440 [Halteromyces radiatus]